MDLEHYGIAPLGKVELRTFAITISLIMIHSFEKKNTMETFKLMKLPEFLNLMIEAYEEDPSNYGTLIE